MPRRGGSVGKSTRSASRPAPVHHSPPPAPAQSGNSGSVIGSTVAEGLAWGTGAALAHRGVDAIMGPRTIRHETVLSGATDACSVHSKAFQDCLNNNGNEISKCQFFMNMLVECKKNSGVSKLNA